MTLQDLGSLGEFVASIATLCTLAYLAVQIRQTTQVTRATAFHNGSRDIFEAVDRVVADPDLCRIYFSGTSDYESLSAEDRRRFGVYMGSLIARLESVIFQKEQGIGIDPAAFSFFYESTRNAFRQPGTQQWWSKARGLYKPNLQELVDDLTSNA